MNQIIGEFFWAQIIETRFKFVVKHCGAGNKLLRIYNKVTEWKLRIFEIDLLVRNLLCNDPYRGRVWHLQMSPVIWQTSFDVPDRSTADSNVVGIVATLPQLYNSRIAQNPSTNQPTRQSTSSGDVFVPSLWVWGCW